MANLFANALEAMPSAGGVRVTADVGSGLLQLRVKDDGPGLPGPVVARLFEPGVTLGKDAGHGLGLAGARTLLRRHGGDLVHEPGAGGACFRLAIPLWTGDAPVGADAAAVAPAPVPGRLLVVDDEPSVLAMLAEVLGLDGHRVSVAHDHDSALARFDPGAYDAVLIDLGLPGRSGLVLAAALRAADPAVALILLTGWGRERELQAVPADLVDFTGVKPLDQPDLRALLARAVSLTAVRRDGRPEA